MGTEWMRCGCQWLANWTVGLSLFKPSHTCFYVQFINLLPFCTKMCIMFSMLPYKTSWKLCSVISTVQKRGEDIYKVQDMMANYFSMLPCFIWWYCFQYVSCLEWLWIPTCARQRDSCSCLFPILDISVAVLSFNKELLFPSVHRQVILCGICRWRRHLSSAWMMF